MSIVKVEYREQTVSYWDDGERYGEWSEDREFSLKSAKIVEDSSYESDCEKFDLDVVKSQTIYVVCVHYEDGDSFGRCTGKGEIVFAYTSEDVARSVSKTVEQDIKKHTINIPDGKGGVFQWSNPCSDYFASLSYVEVESLVVE